MTERVWRLTRGAEAVGEIVIDGSDFPWLEGAFRPGPGYAEVAPWFAEALALLDDEASFEDGRFDTAYDRIAGSLTLSSPDGPVAEFLLHIEGERAWFRWSDEPFEDDRDRMDEGTRG